MFLIGILINGGFMTDFYMVFFNNLRSKLVVIAIELFLFKKLLLEIQGKNTYVF